MSDNLKILVFTDLHSEIIDNADERVNSILNAAKTNNVEAILNIGDFGYHSNTSNTLCEVENQPINYNIFYKEQTDRYLIRTKNLLDKFKNLDIPVLHTLGNHDMDFNSKEQAIESYGMPNNYYYYDFRNFRFIFLDTNYYYSENIKEISYSFGNNFNENKKAILPYEQVEWLKIVLQTDKNIIICSHNVLLNDKRGIGNYEIVNEVLRGSGKKILCLSGHKHVDKLTLIDKLSFLEVNSVSYYWLGEENKVYTDYPDDYLDIHPVLPYILRYPEPLYAIITIEGNNISVEGKSSNLKLSDEDKNRIDKLGITASIKDYKF